MRQCLGEEHDITRRQGKVDRQIRCGCVGQFEVRLMTSRYAPETPEAGIVIDECPLDRDETVEDLAVADRVELRWVVWGCATVKAEPVGARGHHNAVGVVKSSRGSTQVHNDVDRRRVVNERTKRRIRRQVVLEPLRTEVASGRRIVPLRDRGVEHLEFIGGQGPPANQKAVDVERIPLGVGHGPVATELLYPLQTKHLAPLCSRVVSFDRRRSRPS